MKEVLISKRKPFLDIARGILILLVVVGHSSAPAANIIFWFHMPAFFIISGILFKIRKDMNDYIVWTKKILVRNIIPYISYYLVASILLIISTKHFSAKGFLIQTKYFLYGGRATSGVYWFITCLIITEVLFGYLAIKLNKFRMLIIILASYVLAHAESIYIIPSKNYYSMPMTYRYLLNIDVVFLAICYFAIGFYGKELLKFLKKKHIVLGVIIGSILSIVLLYLGYAGVLNYKFDMKYSQYRHLILDLVVPLIFTITILLMSMIFEKYRIMSFISYLGRNTLPIMYLHIPFNSILIQKFKYNYFVYILIGVGLPLLFNILIKQFKITDHIFSGKLNSQAKLRIKESTI